MPTLPTLARIAMVFDVGLDYFFGARRGQRMFSIVRAGERMKFPERPDLPSPAYFFECLAFSAQGKGLQAYAAEFPAREAAAAQEHMHEGAEFVYVVEGRMAIRFEGEEYELGAGDSVYFDATEPHAYRGISPAPAKAVVVTVPPHI